MANTSWLSALSGAFGGSQTIDPSPSIVFSATNVNLTNQYTYNSASDAFGWYFQAMQSATLTNFYAYLTAAAASVRHRPATNAKRYHGFQATGVATVAATASSATLSYVS